MTRLPVTVVVVTYGDRSSLLMRVLDAAFEQGCRSFIVVSNDAHKNLRQRLESFRVRQGANVHLHEMGTNSGSELGVRAGLEHAVGRGDQYVLILDDDNVPIGDCVPRLVRTAEADRARLTCVAATRTGSALHDRLLSGASADELLPQGSSFGGFDALQVIRRRVRAPKADNSTPIELPYTAYGGLLIPGVLVSRLLDATSPTGYVLYEDDSLMTFQLRSLGARLLLDRSASIQDIDAKWYRRDAVAPNRWRTLLQSDSSFRLWYSVRNRAHFDRHVYRRSRLRFAVNRWIYLTLLRVEGRKSPANYSLIRDAIRAGESRRLGLDPRFPLPSS